MQLDPISNFLCLLMLGSSSFDLGSFRSTSVPLISFSVVIEWAYAVLLIYRHPVITSLWWYIHRDNLLRTYHWCWYISPFLPAVSLFGDVPAHAKNISHPLTKWKHIWLSSMPVRTAKHSVLDAVWGLLPNAIKCEHHVTTQPKHRIPHILCFVVNSWVVSVKAWSSQ